MVPMWYTVAPVAIFLIVFGAWSFNNAYSENNAEVKRLRTEMEQLTATHVEMQQKADQQTKLEQQVATAENALQQLQQQHQAMLEGKGKDTVYISDFRSLLPSGAMLTDIRIGSDGVQLEGNVADPFDVITYIKSLEAAGYKLNLKQIDKDSEEGFPFNIKLDTGPAEEAR
jgi:Tfp pilus assembly protein PilN